MRSHAKFSAKDLAGAKVTLAACASRSLAFDWGVSMPQSLQDSSALAIWEKNWLDLAPTPSTFNSHRIDQKFLPGTF